MKILYFRSWNDAVSRAANEGWKQTPKRRRVWVDLAEREEWSLEVPDETAEVTDVRHGHLSDVPQADS